MKTPALDFIGDIHGHHDKLILLLERLGYERRDGTFRHPLGRKAVFLGDYIDRGPRIRETLHLVRGMVEAGDAHAIMGNHEWNAICYATPDGKGGHLREHNDRNDLQHKATLDQFAAHRDEWDGWIAWMKRLPLFLNFGFVRAVHACWDWRRLPALAGHTLTNDAFLHACATKGTPEFYAIENTLKGPELHLPEGVTCTCKEGVARGTIRARWWGITEGMKVGDLAMPEPMVLDHPLNHYHAHTLPDYPVHAAPVLVGHYWMPATAPKKPLTHNIACLDFSGAVGDNPLTAYRWNGEGRLKPEGFITGPTPPVRYCPRRALWSPRLCPTP